MKNIKKLFVAVLSFVLSFCMINTVFAATEKGSIVINGTTNGKIYEVYKIFDLTYSGSGDNLKVAYTIDSAWTNFFSSTGAGAEYIVDLAKDSDGNVINPDNLNVITIGSTTRYINITEENIADFAKDALAYLGANSSVERAAYKEATGETTTIDNLELGYYLVYPEGATEIKDGWKSIVSLTSTTPTAEVDIKATYPTINKTVEENSVEVGEYATFTITGKVPDTTGFTTYTYKIHDSWTEGLEYVADGFNMVVTIGNDSFTVNSENLTVSNDGFTLTIDVKNANYEVGDAITVIYNLKVNSLAINSDTTNNSAYLEYSNNPKNDETSTTPPVEVPVYSSKIEVLKVDGASCTGEGAERTCSIPLAGAKFVLKNNEGKYYSIAEYGMSQDATTGKIIISVNDIKWEDSIDDATVFTTNEAGIISVEFDGFTIGEEELVITAFEGLANGTYYLVETEAPEGFNKLDSEIPVVVSGSTDDNGPIPVIKEVTVENNSGTLLPSTGGMGTKLFITIGSLLAVVSAIVLVTNKRMAKEFM